MRPLSLGTLLQAGRASGASTRGITLAAELPWRT